MPWYRNSYSPLRGLTVTALTILLVACGPGPRSSPQALNESYELALVRSEKIANRFGSGSVREREMLERLSSYFEDMTPASVAEQTLAVYAEDAYLNDNIVFLEGADAIEKYFSLGAEKVDRLRVEFLDVGRSGIDYYIRWRMTMLSDQLNNGQALVSYGVSHFRFAADGRVLLHKDFWDAGTSVYEYLPFVGGIVRELRGRLAH